MTHEKSGITLIETSDMIEGLGGSNKRRVPTIQSPLQNTAAYDLQ